jgi:cell wall-associated NlpC family hydrolase
MLQDLSTLATPLIGAPYRTRGRDPSGWDCWGLVAWCRETWLGRPTPSYAHLYDSRDFATNAGREAKTAEMISREIAAWRPVDPGPGAAALFTLYGKPVHVGFMLNRRDFLHADVWGTSVGDLEAPKFRRKYEFAGCWDA